MKNTLACSGCRNNFYNGNNSLGVKQCWSLPTAKMVTRFRIHNNSAPTTASAFAKVRVPDCYHEPGYSHWQAMPAGLVQIKPRRKARRAAAPSSPERP